MARLTCQHTGVRRLHAPARPGHIFTCGNGCTRLCAARSHTRWTRCGCGWRWTRPRAACAAARGLLRGLLPRPRRVHAGCAGPAFPARLHGPAPMHVCLIGLSGAWRSAWALASTVLAPSTTGQCLTVWTNCAALCIPGLVSACGQQAGSQSTCLRTWLRSRRHSLPFAGGCPG